MIYSIGVIFLCFIALCTKANKKTLLFITFLFLTGIAILFEPQRGLDLYTHYRVLDVMRQIGYADSIIRFRYLMGNLPVYSVLFYLISLLQYDKLLLIIAYFIVYGCMFGVLSMCVADHGWSIKGWKYGYAIIMLITNAYSVTGIRYSLAFAVVFLFLYIDIYRREYRLLSFIMYVLACLLHDGMILVVAFRLLLFIPKNRFTSKLKFLIVFWQVWLNVIGEILKAIPLAYFSSAADKLLLYSTQESADTWVSGIGMETLGMLRIAVLILIVIYCIMLPDNKKDDYKRMLYFLILFCIGGISSAALIDRYTTITLTYAFPFVLTMNKECNKSQDSEKLLVRVETIPMIVLLIAYFGCLVVFQYRYFI